MTGIACIRSGCRRKTRYGLANRVETVISECVIIVFGDTNCSVWRNNNAATLFDKITCGVLREASMAESKIVTELMSP